MDKPITLCDRCDIYMSCLLNYDGSACRRNRTVEPTHADRIRSMTDEEIAYFLSQFADCCVCKAEYGEGCSQGKKCEDFWLSWVKQEAKDGEYI